MALRIEHLPERDKRFDRMEPDGSGVDPSAWCPDCQAPPWRPHRDGCDLMDQ